jgi:hypothetical protein
VQAVASTGVSATLAYFGIAYIHAKVCCANSPASRHPSLSPDSLPPQCTDDLAVWCIVTAGILLVVTVLAVLDGACGLRGMGSDGLPALAAPGSDDDDNDVDYYRSGAAAAGSKRPASTAVAPPSPSFTILAILQLVALLTFVVAWAYGLFIVLNLFSRQHHALPGAELCDRHLYDPVFIITVMVGLVLVLVPLVALCTCLTANLCGGGAADGATPATCCKCRPCCPDARGKRSSEGDDDDDAETGRFLSQPKDRDRSCGGGGGGGPPLGSPSTQEQAASRSKRKFVGGAAASSAAAASALGSSLPGGGIEAGAGQPWSAAALDAAAPHPASSSVTDGAGKQSPSPAVAAAPATAAVPAGGGGGASAAPTPKDQQHGTEGLSQGLRGSSTG